MDPTSTWGKQQRVSCCRRRCGLPLESEKRNSLHAQRQQSETASGCSRACGLFGSFHLFTPSRGRSFTLLLFNFMSRLSWKTNPPHAIAPPSLRQCCFFAVAGAHFCPVMCWGLNLEPALNGQVKSVSLYYG